MIVACGLWRSLHGITEWYKYVALDRTFKDVSKRRTLFCSSAAQPRQNGSPILYNPQTSEELTFRNRDHEGVTHKNKYVATTIVLHTYKEDGHRESQIESRPRLDVSHSPRLPNVLTHSAVEHSTWQGRLLSILRLVTTTIYQEMFQSACRYRLQLTHKIRGTSSLGRCPYSARSTRCTKPNFSSLRGRYSATLVLKPFAPLPSR